MWGKTFNNIFTALGLDWPTNIFVHSQRVREVFNFYSVRVRERMCVCVCVCESHTGCQKLYANLISKWFEAWNWKIIFFCFPHFVYFIFFLCLSFCAFMQIVQMRWAVSGTDTVTAADIAADIDETQRIRLNQKASEKKLRKMAHCGEGWHNFC